MEKLVCVECKGKLVLQNNILCPLCGALPQKIDLFDSMEEMLQFCLKINRKIISLRGYFDTLNLPDHDARSQFLAISSTMIMWLIIQLEIYYKHGKTTKSFIPQRIIKDNPNLSISQITGVMANFDNMNRKSFFVAFMFHVEVFLKSVNRILPKVGKDKGYVELMTFILKELEIANKNEEKHNIMKYSAFVRNSLHNNGIHTEDNEDGKIYGIHFFFNKGEKVNHGGWRHIYFFCDAILNVIELILKHKLVEKNFMKSVMTPQI